MIKKINKALNDKKRNKIGYKNKINLILNIYNKLVRFNKVIFFNINI